MLVIPFIDSHYVEDHRKLLQIEPLQAQTFSNMNRLSIAAKLSSNKETEANKHTNKQTQTYRRSNPDWRLQRQTGSTNTRHNSRREHKRKYAKKADRRN